jgi:hypothetical protein
MLVGNITHRQAKRWSKDGRQYLNKVNNEDETDDQTWDKKIRVIG